MTSNPGARRRSTTARNAHVPETAERASASTARRRQPVPWAVSEVFETINIPPWEEGDVSIGDGPQHRPRRRRRGSGPEVVIEHIWRRTKPKPTSKTSKEREEEKPVPRKETRYMRLGGDEKGTVLIKETAYINPTITMAGTGDKELGIKPKQKDLRLNALVCPLGDDQQAAVMKGTRGQGWFERRSTAPKKMPVLRPVVTPSPSPPSSED